MQAYGKPASTLVNHALEVLRDLIVSGELLPGSPIRVEETAAKLGMSTIPLREALRTLASQGMVVQLSRRGYFVADLSFQDLSDVYRLRMVLDPMALELAIPELTPVDVKGIEDAFDALVEAYETGDGRLSRDRHRAFHFSIYQHSHSPWLLRCLEILWDSSERYQRISALHRGSTADRAAEHRLILDACRRGDVEGGPTVMRKHLAKTVSTMRDLLEAGQP